MVIGQNDCMYELQLRDAFGDGWSGASLRVDLNGTQTDYTLNTESDNGVFRAFNILVMDNDTVTISYLRGANFNADNSFSLINPEGIQVFASDSISNDGPLVEVVYASRLACPDCFVPNPASVQIDDVRAFEATISWTPTETDATYVIEIGEQGFEQGQGNEVNTLASTTTLTDLSEDTRYEFYLTVNCADGTTSRTIGPYGFRTRWAKNVGITAITGPETACGLDPMDSVKIVIENFGGLPQTLIPLRYSVNGVVASIPQPLDGFYTGVLGKDSTAEVAFETLFNFTPPGEYEISAWTELEEDGFIENDTFTTIVTNIPIITTYPYFEDFEIWKGGWTIDPESQNASWAHGEPAGTLINAAVSGTNVWATNLAGPYQTSEFSILVSPCLNFSNLMADPRIAFSINFSSENCCDEAWIEMSLDGGENWSKVGMANSGYNWYNNVQENWWAGDGGFEGWAKAYHTLEGAAGASDVRLRFIFSSDFQKEEEGMALDDIFISAPLARDAAALQVNHTSMVECGEDNDQVVFTVANFGQSTLQNLNVNYQVNDGPVITEQISAVAILPGEQTTYTFTDPFNSSIPGQYEIKAWTTLGSDGFLRNDTLTYTFATAVELPFGEDFESGFLPSAWTFDEQAIVTQEHGNETYALSNNMWAGDPNFSAETPVFGPIGISDSLNFEYRFVNLVGDGSIATTLSAGDQLLVQLSRDCGESYETLLTIDEMNHQPDTLYQLITLQLGEYLGEFVKVRFLASWAMGDYYLDIDQVNVPRCTGSLGLAVDVRGTSSNSATDGRVTITPTIGVGPFEYSWNTGDTLATVSGLSAGAYQVTVTDRFGCVDQTDAIIDVVVDVDELDIESTLKIYPNPTQDLFMLDLQLATTQEVEAIIYDFTGKSLLTRSFGKTSYLKEQLQVAHLPAGMYWLHLRVGPSVVVRKLVKQ